MIIVTGIAEVAEDGLETIRKAAKTMAAASRSEAGCRAYAFYEDIEQTGRFRIYEEWETIEALRNHFATDHMAQFNKELAGITLVRLDIDQFERGKDVRANA